MAAQEETVPVPANRSNLLRLLCLAVLPSLTFAQTAKPQADQSSSLVVRPATQEQFHAIERAEADTRRINERLNFRLHSLTGITFRMWFCGLEPIRDKPILARMLDSAALPEGGREIFVRWYELKLRLSENSVYVWRKMGAEQSMKNIECASENVASSHAWIAEHGR